MPTTQYLRFTPIKRRDAQNVNEYALCEFRIYNGGSEVSLSGTTVTCAGYSGDPLSNLVDNNNNNKIFPFGNPLVMDFGSSKTFTQYRFVFMNAQVDHPAYGRTPIRWTVETSTNGSTWTMFDDRSASDQTLAAAIVGQWGEFPTNGSPYPRLPSVRIIAPTITVGTNASEVNTYSYIQYYTLGLKTYQIFRSSTDTITLTYQITSDGTTSIGSGVGVTLYANAPYSGSNATWLVNGTTNASAVGFDGSSGAVITATTDSNGQVTFTLQNTNSSGFEPIPNDIAGGPPGSGRLYGTFKAIITGYADSAEDIDTLEIDVTGAAPYCLAKGTLVLTPSGYVPVESLDAGDKIVSGDKRAVTIKSVFSTKYSKTTKQTAPYTIEANAFGENCPPNALTVSGRHAIQIADNLWEIPEEAAKSNKLVKQAPAGTPVTYYHIALPDYAKDTLVANGQIVESLNDKQYKETYAWNSKLGGYERKLSKYVTKTLSH